MEVEEKTKKGRKRDFLSFSRYINHETAAFIKCKLSVRSAAPHYFCNYCIQMHIIITEVIALLWQDIF